MTGSQTRPSSLHPWAALLYLVTWMSAAMICSHPLILLALFLGSIINLVVALRHRPAGSLALKVGLSMVPLILVLNVAFNPGGNTVLFQTPAFLGFPPHPVSLESLAFGLFQSGKILTVMALCGSFPHFVSQERLLHWSSARFPKLGFLTMSSFLALPRLRRDLNRAATVLETRGVPLHGGRLPWRALVCLPLWRILLQNSLESSLETSEALASRGFGVGPRSRFHVHSWHLADSWASATCLAGGILLLVGARDNLFSFDWFPSLSSTATGSTSLLAIAIFLSLLLFPLLRNPVSLLRRGFNSESPVV